MKRIINILENTILLIDQKMKALSITLNTILLEKKFIGMLHFDPDNLNIENLKKEVPKEYLDKLEYIEKLKGWYQDFSDEPQVELALNYINDIEYVLSKQKNFSIRIITKKYKQCKKLRENCEMLLAKIEKYDRNTYIEEKELAIIESLIDEEEIDEDIISIFSRIGENNAFIRIRKEKGQNLFNEFKNDTDSELFKKKDLSDLLFIKIRKILSSDIMLYAYVGDIKLVEAIKNYFTMIFSIEDKITNEIIEEADVFKEELESIEDSTIYMVAITLLIIDAIEKNNSDVITSILETYKNSKYCKIINSLENQLLVIKKRKLEQIVEDYYIEEEYIKFSSAYVDISELELRNFVSLETIQSMKIMKLIYENYHKKDDLNLEQLDELINTLELYINDYKQIQSEFDEKEELIVDGLDIADVLNYVVFLNTDRIQQNIENIIRDYDVNLSSFTSAIYKLLMISKNELYSRDTCKPIISNSRPNEYEIREERAGSIRICFKSISSCNGKPVYEILGFAYGSCGDKRKNDNLKESIKEYITYHSDYKELERIFSENNTEQISTIVSESLDFYNSLVNKEKKKVKE